MRAFLLVAALLLASACSTDGKFRQYYGKPVQYVILDHGEPNAMVPMPGNEMAFQWQLEANTVAASVIGDKPPLIDMTKCKYTVFTSWDELREAWVVYSHEDVPFGC